MTNQNEKKSDDEFSISFLLKELKEKADAAIAKSDELEVGFLRELEFLNQRLASEKKQSPAYRELMLWRRFLGTQMTLFTTIAIMKLQDYVIGLHLAKLEDKMEAKPVSASLTEELDDVKKRIDEHIAKRLGQLFDKDGKEYIG